MSDVNSTLSERGSNYGPFESHAEITQRLKTVMVESPAFYQMKHYEAEALEMIFHKVGRMLNGNPHYIDNWHDIQGYAKLVEDILKTENGA